MKQFRSSGASRRLVTQSPEQRSYGGVPAEREDFTRQQILFAALVIIASASAGF